MWGYWLARLLGEEDALRNPGDRMFSALSEAWCMGEVVEGWDVYLWRGNRYGRLVLRSGVSYFLEVA